MAGTLSSVAHHEAGHAVIAYQFGAVLESIHLRSRETSTGRSWRGTLACTMGYLAPEHVAQVAFAGPLAKCKHLVCDEFKIDQAAAEITEASLPRILAALRATPQWNQDLKYAEVEVTANNVVKSLRIFFGDFCDDWEAAINALGDDAERQVYPLLWETKNLIDKPEIRKRIAALASHICDVGAREPISFEISSVQLAQLCAI